MTTVIAKEIIEVDTDGVARLDSSIVKPPAMTDELADDALLAELQRSAFGYKFTRTLSQTR